MAKCVKISPQPDEGIDSMEGGVVARSLEDFGHASPDFYQAAQETVSVYNQEQQEESVD